MGTTGEAGEILHPISASCECHAGRSRLVLFCQIAMYDEFASLEHLPIEATLKALIHWQCFKDWLFVSVTNDEAVNHTRATHFMLDL